MGSFGAISGKIVSRRGCNCCWASKPIGAPSGPCSGCVAAGCEFRCGNWFRGTGKDKDGNPNGRPICPARERGKKAAGASARARKMVLGKK